MSKSIASGCFLGRRLPALSLLKLGRVLQVRNTRTGDYLSSALSFQAGKLCLEVHLAPLAIALTGIHVTALFLLNTVLALALCLCIAKGWSSGLSTNTSPYRSNQKTAVWTDDFLEGPQKGKIPFSFPLSSW